MSVHSSVRPPWYCRDSHLLTPNVRHTTGHRKTPLVDGSSKTGVSKNGEKSANFRPINRYISETIEERRILTKKN